MLVTQLVGPTEPSARRFTIADAMIVVALTAFGLVAFSQTVAPARIAGYVREAPGLVRFLYLDGPLPASFVNTQRPAMVEYLRTTPVTTLEELGLPLLPLSTLAFLLIRLRKPRPPWRDLLRQPGMAGVLAVILAIFFEVDLRWLGVPIPTPMPLNTGLAVAIAWSVLGVTRLWRAEPSWIDRLGLVLGVCWIVLGLVVAVDGWVD